MTILLIDDHDLVLKGLLSVLRSAFPKTGFITARSGEEALEAVRGTHVDLAVLDLELPDIPGFRLIELLRGEAPGIRIVVNTVHEEIWTLRQLEQSSVDGIVFKSATPRSWSRPSGGCSRPLLPATRRNPLHHSQHKDIPDSDSRHRPPQAAKPGPDAPPSPRKSSKYSSW